MGAPLAGCVEITFPVEPAAQGVDAGLLLQADEGPQGDVDDFALGLDAGELLGALDKLFVKNHIGTDHGEHSCEREQ
jgi:hypothetical protein